MARRQLLALGFGVSAIAERCACASLNPMHREVFAVGHRRATRRSRWWAAVLAYGERALLSHHSAATLWGVARRGAGPVHVTAPRGRQGIDRRAGIWLHRCRIDPADRATRDGIPVTTVARTLFDLAEALSERHLAQAWEEADRLGLLRLAEVEEVCAHGRGRRALRPIRRLLAEAHWVEPTRSPLEDRFLAFCHERRLPPPETNVQLLGREVDALWPAARLVAELDGFAYHRHRAAFERDRSRDAALLVAGYRILHVTDHRLAREPDTLEAQIRQLLAR